MIVVLGGNEFIDCENILSAKGEPLLSIRSAPLSVTVTTPNAWPPPQAVAVVGNEVLPEQNGIRVIRDEACVCVVFHEFPMVLAVSESPDRVLLRLDLRAIGINVFDDASGLHIGGNFFRGNRVSNSATAISLA